MLSLCQSDVANDFIRRCCQQEGIRFLQSNKFTDNVWSIEELINESDLVVGLGRSAYDAMACGRCVLVYDYREYMGEFLGDGMLTPESIQKSMLCNCSGRSNRLKYNEETFIKELQKYSPELGAWGREFALEHLNIEKAVEAYLDIYRGIDFEQKLIALKRQKLDMQKASEQELQAVNDSNTKLQEQLFEQKQQTASLLAFYEAKSRKHLRAIRALIWLSIALAAALVALVSIR